jgi:hypothetical protein
LKVLTDRLGAAGKLAIIEIKVEDLIASPETGSETVKQVVRETESHLLAGQDTLVMTSRKLITGADELSSLKIGSVVAEALVSVLQQIEVRPRYIIAKVCTDWCFGFFFETHVVNVIANDLFRAELLPLMLLPRA